MKSKEQSIKCINRKREDSDGECFASIGYGSNCKVMSAASSDCGTYACPFYKPLGLDCWARIDNAEGIRLLPPDSYGNRFRK